LQGNQLVKNLFCPEALDLELLWPTQLLISMVMK